MKNTFIKADSFIVPKHKLRIYRIAERGTAVILWTSEEHAITYIQGLHIQKLLTKDQSQ